jgi:hypothetical protein
MGIEPKALHMLGQHSTHHVSSHFVLFCFVLFFDGAGV